MLPGFATTGQAAVPLVAQGFVFVFVFVFVLRICVFISFNSLGQD